MCQSLKAACDWLCGEWRGKEEGIEKENGREGEGVGSYRREGDREGGKDEKEFW